jgi:hypothetical protein
MKLKITKLDRRHAGFVYWKYYVERPRGVTAVDSKRLFLSWREWCWTTWGPSKEMNMFDHTDLFDNEYCSNDHWSWLNDEYGRSRIYFRTEQEVEVFVLRWS